MNFHFFILLFYLFFYFNHKVRKGFAKDAVNGWLLFLLTEALEVNTDFYFNRKVRKSFAKVAVNGWLLSLLTSSASVSIQLSQALVVD